MRELLSSINLVTLPSQYLIDDLVFPSLGVLYLSSVLKKQKHKVSVIDLHGYGNDWKHALTMYADSDADVWGISCVTPEFPLAIQAMKEIKSFDPYTRVVIGGPMATCNYQACLEAGFDQVIVGEGEQAMLKIMAGCRDRVLKEPLIHNLDEIPFPDRYAIDIHRYHYEIEDKKSTNIVTSRGCYWSKCRFCCQVWERRLRYRSAENVIKELESISGMGFGGVMIVDDEFFSIKKRDFKICIGLKDLGMAFRCLTRSDLVTEEVARIAARAGCGEILLGIESGSSKILETINKGVTKEQHKKAIKILKENDIRVKALFMVGLPGESRDTVEETISFIEETEPDVCEFTIYTPYPSSDFWDNPYVYDILFNKERILSSGAWYKGIKGNYTSHVSTSYLAASEIVELRENLERSYGKT